MLLSAASTFSKSNPPVCTSGLLFSGTSIILSGATGCYGSWGSVGACEISSLNVFV